MLKRWRTNSWPNDDMRFGRRKFYNEMIDNQSKLVVSPDLESIMGDLITAESKGGKSRFLISAETSAKAIRAS